MKGSFLYLILIFVMMVWGLNVIAIKVVVSQFSVITITSLRIFTAFLTLLPLIFYRKLFRKLPKREFLYIFGVATFGVLGHQYFLSVGLNHTSATNGGLILGAVPIATSIAAAIFLGDKLTVGRVCGLLLGFSGVATIILASSQGAFTISFGDFYLCLAVLTQALSFVMIKKVSATVDTAYITVLSQIIGAFMLLSISFYIEPAGLSTLKGGTSTVWLIFAGSAIISTALGHLLYNYAIQQLGAGKSAIFLNLSPFFAIIGASLFLGEKIVTTHWVGFILIVSGVLLGSGMLDQLRTNVTAEKLMKP